jgi:hypothetical protein
MPDAASPSQASIEDALISASMQTDDTGKVIHIPATQIVIPFTTRFRYQEIIKSIGRSDTANRADNVLRGEDLEIIPCVHIDPTIVQHIVKAPPGDTQIKIRVREQLYRDSWKTNRNRNRHYAMFYAEAIGVSSKHGFVGTKKA